MPDDSYVPRLLDQVIADRLARFSAVLVTGPRATGKTTTAERLVRDVLRLDRPQEAAIVDADPDAALSDRPTPLLIDEWQVAPEILGAIKRRVDHDHTPGQFVVTGSVRARLDTATWPGTGRLQRVHMSGLTTRERLGHVDAPGLIDRLVDIGPDALVVPADPPDLRGYITEMFVSGFPTPAVALDPTDRPLWFDSYIDEVVTRDAELVSENRDPVRLRRYLDALAANTAGVVDDTTLNKAAGLNRKTGSAYESLLTGLALLDVVPAWWTNRIKRLTQRPKRFLTDPALAAAAIGIDQAGVMRDGDMLGRLVETFVYAQLRAEAAASATRSRIFHLRTMQGRQEIDLVVELPNQQVVGIEIKATSAPTRQHARHLVWLKETLGDKYLAGIVFHTGPRVFQLADGVTAAPIATLWG